MKKIKVLIVDDHKMIRDGLRSMLESHKKRYHFVIEEAETGEAGILQVKKSNYDIVLMDYQLPKLNGAETTREMLRFNPNINILGLSNYDESIYVENIINAGAKGYVLKNIDANELIKAILDTLNGKNYYSTEIAAKLLNPDKQKLSIREFEILRLIAAEHSTKEIADKLCLSKRTVEKHREHLLRKMKVSNTAGLLRQAQLCKLID